MSFQRLDTFETDAPTRRLRALPPLREEVELDPYDQGDGLATSPPAPAELVVLSPAEVRKYGRRLIGAILVGWAALTAAEKAVEIVARPVVPVVRGVISDVVNRFDGVECSGATVVYQVPPQGTMTDIAQMVDPGQGLNLDDLIDTIEAMSGHDSSLGAGERLTIPAPNTCRT